MKTPRLPTIEHYPLSFCYWCGVQPLVTRQDFDGYRSQCRACVEESKRLTAQGFTPQAIVALLKKPGGAWRVLDPIDG